METARKPISFIATADPARAQSFYEDVLGLDLVEASQFALVFADSDNILRVQIVETLSPAPFTVHGWQVTDIDFEIRTLTSRGAAFLKFERLPQDGLGVWTTPDDHKIAWFKDPSGNVLSLTQMADA